MLLVIDPQGEWDICFKVLQEEDIRGPGHEEDDDNTKRKQGREADWVGEGYYTVSWIWTVLHGPGLAALNKEEREANPSECLNNMRVEWAHSQAQAEWWGEEQQLLEEEMRCTIEFFKWKVCWWQLQATHCLDVPKAVERGLRIYAERQVCVFPGLAQWCTSLWIPYLQARSPGMTTPAWTLCYKPTAPKAKGKGRVVHTCTVLEDSSSSESSDKSDHGDVMACNTYSDNDL